MMQSPMHYLQKYNNKERVHPGGTHDYMLRKTSRPDSSDKKRSEQTVHRLMSSSCALVHKEGSPWVMSDSKATIRLVLASYLVRTDTLAACEDSVIQ